MKEIYVFNTLRRHRKLFLLNQKEVAEEMGLRGSGRISEWENGKTMPNVVNLFKLSQLYRTSPTELYFKLWDACGKTSAKIICGLSLGTRTTGIAIMYRSKLVYWRSLSFPEKWSVKKRRRILVKIENILVRYQVSEIVLKKIDPRKSSPGLDLIVADVLSLPKKNGIPLSVVHLNILKHHWSAGEKMNLRKLTLAVWDKYPELRPHHRNRITPIPKDVHRVFLAAALAKRYVDMQR